VLRVRVCGGLELEHNGHIAPDALVGGRQGRLVLAYLACERHRPVSRDELAELLWGERPPDSWPASLSAVVSRLRRLITEVGLDGASTLATVAGSYQLLLPPGSAIDFEELVADVEAAEAAVEAGDAEGALALAGRAEDVGARGFLADDCEWVDRQRTAVHALRVRATLARSTGPPSGPARRAEPSRRPGKRSPSIP
jgi:DNA-binding SARP family transcriptional activator